MIYNLGSQIQLNRKIKKLTQEQLAQQIGVRRSEISQYENGVRQPTCEVLMLLSEVFGISTDELLGIKKGTTLDVSGLCARDINIVKDLVERLRENYGKE